MDAAGHVAEPVPLLQEIVAAVIADLLDERSVNAADLVHVRSVDDDLADEMRFHIEREIEANVARGMSPDAARRAARLTVGSVDDAQERARDERPANGKTRSVTRTRRVFASAKQRACLQRVRARSAPAAIFVLSGIVHRLQRVAQWLIAN